MKNKLIYLSLFVFFIFSIIAIYYTGFILNKYRYYYIKQIIFIIIGLVLFIFLKKSNNNYVYKYSKYFYILNVILLIVVLFADKVNGSRSWIKLGMFSFQPSEFMKFTLIIYLSTIINDKRISEFKRIIYSIIITLIPSILTFIEPDTGIVISYIISLFFIIIFSDIRVIWPISLFSIFFLLVLVFYILVKSSNPFINKIFGDSISYRLERFNIKDGYQINNALIGIGNGNLFGNLDKKYIIYIIEAPTDFIFTTILTYFGFILSFILIVFMFIFDYSIIKLSNNIIKLQLSTIYGFVGILLYQQFEHIFMNLGLMPITGITLPFLSYGGSSLLSYLIMLGFILSFKDSYRYG